MSRAAPILVLTGPTAAGKKEIGLAVARRLGAEVVSLDSVKVYRGLDVGAAKPDPREWGDVPLHLVDIAEPDETYSVGRWLTAAAEACAGIRARGRPALFLGGTPLYLQALLRGLFEGPPADPEIRRRLAAEAAAEGVEELHRRLTELDPEAAARIQRRDFKRISRALEVHERTGVPISRLQAEGTERRVPGPFAVAALRVAEADLKQRLERRVDRMLEGGLVEEVGRLAAAGRLRGEAAAAIGYREALSYLDGRLDRDALRDEILRGHRRLVRRQLKWFRRFPEIRWIDRDAKAPAGELVERVVRALDAASR